MARASTRTRCVSCGVELDESNCHRRGDSPGWRHRCKVCEVARADESSSPGRRGPAPAAASSRAAGWRESGRTGEERLVEVRFLEGAGVVRMTRPPQAPPERVSLR